MKLWELTFLVRCLGSVGYIDKLNYKNIEVILLPDFSVSKEFAENNFKDTNLECHIIPTGAVSPAIKRDMGAEKCSGDILAFIDDDAYPAKDWLDKVMPHFNSRFKIQHSKLICAVGGPQITPSSDSFWQKVSGAMFLSFLNGKAADRYYSGEKSYEVDDWPSVNLAIKKEFFLEVGGFDNSYWPGEDTKLCYDLIKTGKKIIYEPNAIVFHPTLP